MLYDVMSYPEGSQLPRLCMVDSYQLVMESGYSSFLLDEILLD